MKQTSTSTGRLVKIVRWTARILATLMAAFVFLLAAGEGFNPTRLTPEESVMMLGFFATWAGFIVGWKLEGVGGIMVIGGLAWHCLFEYVFRGSVFLGFWVLVPRTAGSSLLDLVVADQSCRSLGW